MTISLTKSLLKRTNLHKHLLQLRRASGGGHGHEPEFNEPSGYLFGEKPLPPGQKRVKEDWENYWYYGMGGSLLFGTIIYFYKPDTSVNTWATKEAEKRLQERNIVLDYPKTEKKL